jgi:MoxR-like ATPase
MRYDAQVEDARVKDASNYVTLQALGQAIAAGVTRVVLIDEIDKAPRDFPNDLLDVIEAMRFEVRETNTPYQSKASARPIVFISSNSEKQLPDPFLRRCVFHHIDFPSTADLELIVSRNLGPLKLETKLVREAIGRFEELRNEPLEKKPATAELLVWLRVLHRAGELPNAGKAPWDANFARALLKTRDDLERALAKKAPAAAAEPATAKKAPGTTPPA